MSETVRIPSAPPERTSQSYAALRQAGMERIRRLAKETWTDHNVHDPGITLLEAFCYAMTELGLRLDLEVADLLRSGEVHAPAGLVPARRVLPSAPVTTEDLRRVLLDHPLVADARITPGAEGEVLFYLAAVSDPPFTYEPGDEAVRPRGLSEVLLAFAEEDSNSNTYAAGVTVEVDSVTVTATLDIALPHWDEAEAAPFREGAGVDSVAMLDPGTRELPATDDTPVWRPVEESQSFFGVLRVGYTGTEGAATADLWVLLRITGSLLRPAVEAPAILAAARSEVIETPGGTLGQRFAARVRAAAVTVERLERYLAVRRNLGEEVVRLSPAREQEIAIGARIEVTGSTDLERLLAEIFLAVDRQLSPPIRFHSLAEMRRRGRGVDEVFSGPLLRHGFLDAGELAGRARPGVLYTSDVLRLIMRLRRAGGGDLVAQENPGGRDIVAVTDLELANFVNNRPITTGARDCLRLVEVERYRPRLSLAKSRITLVRDEVEVAYDAPRVQELFLELRREERETVLPADPSPALPVIRGESLPVEEYTPLQNDLPRLYGVGEHGLPPGAGAERRAKALQAQGYLLLFEQFLADLTAQLGNVNRFFSADPGERATYFSRPLLDLPGAPELLRSAPGDEDPEVFRDRRNRMLDHLLARQGEETVAWGQELHRQVRAQLVEAGVAAADVAAAVKARRPAVNQRLIRDKAAFLAAVPELNAAKLQAFGHPLEWRRDVLRLAPDAADAGRRRWSLALGGEVLLRSMESYATEAAALFAAEEAAVLAPQPAFYLNQHVGGGRRRYRLTDGSGAGARVLGESPRTFLGVPATQSALEAAAARFAALRREQSPSAMERRVAHLTGVRRRFRRRLIVAPAAFFELLDTAPGDGVVDGWRLRRQSGPPAPSGEVLLASAAAFTGADDVEALAAARRSIAAAARYGLDEWHYRPVALGDGFELLDAAGEVIARSAAGTVFASPQAAAAAWAETVDHLYLSYSAEGFHLVEHLLLRPRRGPDSDNPDGDPFLSLPLSETARDPDPYSQRLSLVFPSGAARDFSFEDPDAAPRTPVAPHRFRDPEFRRHAEHMVRRACPAHLLPTVYWVDREAPATSPSEASFEGFEGRYFTWLDSLLIPGVEPRDAALAREELIASLNAIAREAGR